jgi:hypothetical protein
MYNFDRSKSLEQLEDKNWGEPDYESRVFRQARKGLTSVLQARARLRSRLRLHAVGSPCLSTDVRRDNMTSNLKGVLGVMALLIIAGCAKEDPVVAVARADFRKERPNVKIVESGVRRRDADHTIVYVRFVSTPATAFPQQAGIWEDERVYKSEGGKSLCMSSKSGKYIRPAR